MFASPRWSFIADELGREGPQAADPHACDDGLVRGGLQAAGHLLADELVRDGAQRSRPGELFGDEEALVM